MWRPCEYKEWRAALPDGEGCVCATAWPLDGAPAAVKWVELGDEDDPREAETAHAMVRLLAFMEWEDGGG
jgi:hypothetical protein